MSALLPKADMCGAVAHVCFGPIADMTQSVGLCSYIAYSCGAGIGRMLDTFQPSTVFTTTWLIRNRVGCAFSPAGEIMNVRHSAAIRLS